MASSTARQAAIGTRISLCSPSRHLVGGDETLDERRDFGQDAVVTGGTQLLGQRWLAPWQRRRFLRLLRFGGLGRFRSLAFESNLEIDRRRLPRFGRCSDLNLERSRLTGRRLHGERARVRIELNPRW